MTPTSPARDGRSCSRCLSRLKVRGAGLGTRLMEQLYVELRAAEIHELAIGVIATNERAMRFYERQGFRPWVVTTLGRVPDVESSVTD